MKLNTKQIRNFGLLFLLTISFFSYSQKKSNPNIVIIFTDDQGYGDLSSFESETINTPNIDSLALSGAKLTDFHVASSVCSPSRAALLTGSYPIRTGVSGVLFPEGNGFGNSTWNKGLNPNEITIPELLKTVGYSTAMAGKWHLGDRLPFLPTKQGFDSYFGIPYSNDMNRGKLPLMLNEDIFEVEPDQSLLTQRFTKFGIDFINKQNGKSPFFLYLAHSMPHIPIYASEKYKGSSKGGVYGDVIQEIDASVGEIVKTLKEKGFYENTLIIFTSDNGPWLSYGNHGGSAGKLRGGKFDVFEGGFRVPCVISWPDEITPGTVIDELISTIDLLPTLAEFSGYSLPDNKIDGLNVAPLLTGKKFDSLDNRMFYFHNNLELKAVRKGHWKYIKPVSYGELAVPGLDGVNGKMRSLKQGAALYNLDDDIAESINLLKVHPEIASELSKKLATFEKELLKDARPIGTMSKK